MISRILCLAHSILSMIPADDQAAYGCNVHHDGNHNQGQIRLIEYGAEEYQKDADISSQTQSFAMTDPVAHEAVVLVGRIAQHKGADNRQKSDQQDNTIHFIGIHVPHETKKQEGVGITIQYRIKPAAVRTALIREPGYFTVTAVYDRGELCHKTTQ